MSIGDDSLYRVLTFKVKTGKQDQVFGTISTKQISSELEKI